MVPEESTISKEELIECPLCDGTGIRKEEPKKDNFLGVDFKYVPGDPFW